MFVAHVAARCISEERSDRQAMDASAVDIGRLAVAPSQGKRVASDPPANGRSRGTWLRCRGSHRMGCRQG